MTKISKKHQYWRFATLLPTSACILGMLTPNAVAQDAPRPAQEKIEIIRLRNQPTQADQNELLTAMRNLIAPSVRIFLVHGENAIAFRGPQEDFATVRQLVQELDKPHKLYRLTFAVRDSEAGKEIGLQHFAVVVAAGERVQLKEGSRVPIITGSYGTTSPTPQTQFTYIDVGINFDATIDEVDNGLRLRSKVERSSLAEDKSAFGKDDPVIRQSTVEGTSLLTLGKPQSLGSLDTSGSTRHVDLEVTAEIVK